MLICKNYTQIYMVCGIGLCLGVRKKRLMWPMRLLEWVEQKTCVVNGIVRMGTHPILLMGFQIFFQLPKFKLYTHNTPI
jgi:hypothetical protein